MFSSAFPFKLFFYPVYPSNPQCIEISAQNFFFNSVSRLIMNCKFSTNKNKVTEKHDNKK